MSEGWRRFKLFITRNRAAQELEEEIRLHRTLRAEALHRDGMSSEAAVAAAARRFGNATTTAEVSRDQWGWKSMDEFVNDLRYAARRLLQRPGFTFSVAGVLALGVGATTAMFSAVDAALLRPLPFANPEELFDSEVQVPFSGRRTIPENERFPDVTDLSKMRETFSHVAAYAAGGLNLSDPERPVRLKAGVVTRDFFATLGVLPQLGRVFDTTEVAAGGPRAAILSWAFWQQQFGGRPFLDSTVTLNNRSYRVVGIMPRGFGFPDASDVWVPMSVPTTSATFDAFRGYMPSSTIVRLAPGISLSTAASRFTAVWDRFANAYVRAPGRAYPQLDRMTNQMHNDGGFTPLRVTLVGERKRALVVLFGATMLLLCITCVNVMSLLLAHGTARQRELGIRGVLGATRGRIVRQLLAESVLISLIGTAVGVALAPVGLRIIAALMPPTLAGLSAATVDARVLVFAASLALTTGVAFGLWPAYGATRLSMGETVKVAGTRGSSAYGTRRAQQVLIGGELALTMVLLISAGLMLRSFHALVNTDSGLRAERTGALEVSFPRVVGADRVQRYEQILARLQATPGISGAAVVNDLPLSASGGISIGVEVPGSDAPADDSFARMLVASERYFDVMGIKLLRGRVFERTDDQHGPKVAIVDEEFERKYWHGENAVGKTFTWGGDSVPLTVIGVVAHVRESGLDRNPAPQMYFPARTEIGDNLAIVARGTLEPRLLLAQLKSALQSVDRSQAITHLRMMNEVIGNSVSSRRANTLLIGLFGAVALAVSIFGVYAVTAYAVAQRNREFGIRSALGASRAALLREAGLSIGRIAIAGIVLGIGLAWAASRVVSSLLYSVSMHDAKTFTVAPIVLLLAALTATLVPARRALRANPVEIMRED